MDTKKFDRSFILVFISSIIVISAVSMGVSQSFYYPLVLIDGVERPVDDAGTLDGEIKWTPYWKYIIYPAMESEMAGDAGNLYAPEILYENNTYHMWYGAQSADGHDSIHYATSSDGINWIKYGTVIPNGENNHVNDPSVVKVNGTYYMYYTVAPVDELDEIWLATSDNGINWTIVGCVLNASSDAERWDSLKVGRPSVLYQDGLFKMWFDGMQRDPEDPTIWAEGTGRHVGYATSPDGIHWTRYADNPIVLNSGAVDVEYLNGKYIMVEESQEGILYRIGINETTFDENPRFLFKNTGTSADRYGHVTPFIFIKDGKWVATYTGAATSKGWNQNKIMVWFPMENISIEGASEAEKDLSKPTCWAISPRTMLWAFDKTWNDGDIKITITKDNIQSEIILSLDPEKAQFTIRRTKTTSFPQISDTFIYNRYRDYNVFSISYLQGTLSRHP